MKKRLKILDEFPDLELVEPPRYTGSGHVVMKLRNRMGHVRTIVDASTPSDWRAIRNTRARLKRHARLDRI